MPSILQRVLTGGLKNIVLINPSSFLADFPPGCFLETIDGEDRKLLEVEDYKTSYSSL